NTISSPASGTAPAAITVPPPRTRTSQDRSTTVPAGIPLSGDATVRVASTTSGTVESTRAPWHRAGFDTHTLTRSPTCLQTTAKHQVTASSKPTALSPWCWAWTPRELRHSFVSILSGHDVCLEDISDLVGHSSTSFTETVYPSRDPVRPHR